MKKFCLKIKKPSLFIFVFLIFVISISNLHYFSKPGIFQGHDSENHLARIANYYLAIKDGHIPSRWAKNLNHKFGYPVFNFNYPLPNIAAYPLIVLGFSIESSLKIVLFCAYFSAGLFFFLWLKKHFSAGSAFVGALFYICAPYQFLDLYVRGVVGENLTFALLPAVLLFLNLLFAKINWFYTPSRKPLTFSHSEKLDFKNKVKFSLRCMKTFLTNKLRSIRPQSFHFLSLVICTAGFSLSHNLMVMIFTPLIFIYWFYLVRTKKNRQSAKFSFVGLLLGFMLTMFFWLPAFFEKKYVTLDAFNPQSFYQDHFVSLKQLFDSTWQFGYSVPGFKDTMSFQLGLIHWLVVFLSFFVLIFQLRKIKNKIPWLFCQLGFWLGIFLMLPASLFLWKILPLIGYLQFPWRLLALTLFFSAVLAAFLAEKVKWLSVFFSLACFVYIQPFTKPFLWEKKQDMYYYDFLFTTSVRHENKPIWFQESNIDKFKERFLSEPDKVTFKQLEWKTNKHVYEIDVPKPSYIWEQTAYFPGWKVFLDNKEIKINYDDEKFPGIIGFEVPQGKFLVKTVFTQDTWPRKIGNGLTIFGLVLLLLSPRLMIFIKRKQK